MQINIAFSINDKYTQHAGTLIASILYNATKEDSYKFFIVTDGLDNDNKSKLETLKSIKDFEIEYIITDGSEFKNIDYNKNLHISAFYRFYLFNIKSVDKILYLDSDIVVRCDIKELFSTNIDNYCIAGVEDIVAKTLINKYNLSPTTTYINSGVMLLNLNLLREVDVFLKIKEFAQLYPNQNYGDQDIINYIFQDKILSLDLKYNFCFPYNTTYDDKNYYFNTSKNPAIMHYITQAKPWVPGANPYMKNEYFKYLKMTPWYKDFITQYLVEENSIILSKLNSVLKKLEN